MNTSPGSTLSFQRPLGRLRGGLRDALALSLTAAFTTWVALLSWNGFATEWGGFMGPLIAIALVVALSGALLRWLRVPGPLVVLAQVVIVGAVVSLFICGSLVPIGDAWVRMELAFQDASATAQQYAAPVPSGVPRSTHCSSRAVPPACCWSTSWSAPCAGCPWPASRC